MTLGRRRRDGEAMFRLRRCSVREERWCLLRVGYCCASGAGTHERGGGGGADETVSRQRSGRRRFRHCRRLAFGCGEMLRSGANVVLLRLRRGHV